jgi:hypothetical protein
MTAAAGTRPQPTPPGPAALSERCARRASALSSWYVSVGFAANFIGALHSPKPHHVKVAIVGAPAATRPLAHVVSVKARGGLNVSQLTTVAQARRLVGDRKLAATSCRTGAARRRSWRSPHSVPARYDSVAVLELDQHRVHGPHASTRHRLVDGRRIERHRRGYRWLLYDSPRTQVLMKEGRRWGSWTS